MLSLVTAMLLATTSLPAALPAQEDDPVERALDVLTEAVDEGEAPGIRDAMKRVLDTYRELDPKQDERDRKKLAAYIGRLLEYPRASENGVALYAAEVLGKFGKPGAELLAGALEKGDFESDDQRVLYERMLTMLGRTAEPEAVPVLLEHLKHHQPGIVAAAAKSLRHFDESPGELRKKIAEALLFAAEYVETKTEVQRARPGRGVKAVEEDWVYIQPALFESLRSVTGEFINEIDAWREWFEENRSRDWDAKEEEKQEPDGKR